MIHQKSFVFALLLALSLSASAQLPALSEKPWLGHFVGHECREYRFGIKETGVMGLEVFSSKGAAMGFDKTVIFAVEIVENNGATKTIRRPLSEAFTTENAATNKPEKVTLKGKVGGNAEFELVIEFDDELMKLGARITNPGTLKNPTLQIRSRFQKVYHHTPEDKLEELTKKDRIDVVTIDKKRDKLSAFDPVDLASEKISGKGLTNLRVEMKAYEGKRFEYSIEGPGRIVLGNPGDVATAPMHGFSVIWQADAAKDPEGKARFVMEVK
jgi:hypothetical protein